MSSEAATGYWNSSIVAIRLLEPLLKKAYSSGSNRRINEDFEDFVAFALPEIQQGIATYDKSLSHFPNYIKPHITHLKCTYNQDTSYYLARKTGYRVYSQNALQEHAHNTSASYDKMLDDMYSNDGTGYDPAQTSSLEDTTLLAIMINDLIQEVAQHNPLYGHILLLIKQQYTRGEILDVILPKYGLKKTQGYSEIKAAQQLAKELFSR